MEKERHGYSQSAALGLYITGCSLAQRHTPPTQAYEPEIEGGAQQTCPQVLMDIKA